MSNEALTPEIYRGGEVSARRLDPRTALPFVNKSVSEETRRAYRRTLAEFFQFVAGRHPANVTPSDVMLWRDGLRARRRKPATVAFKLAVVRSFFEHLKAGGVSPHDLRRTAITKALDSGMTYRQVQMKSKHRDPKTVMRYDHGRENMEQNAVNFLGYEE